MKDLILDLINYLYFAVLPDRGREDSHLHLLLVYFQEISIWPLFLKSLSPNIFAILCKIKQASTTVALCTFKFNTIKRT